LSLGIGGAKHAAWSKAGEWKTQRVIDRDADSDRLFLFVEQSFEFSSTAHYPSVRRAADSLGWSIKRVFSAIDHHPLGLLYTAAPDGVETRPADMTIESFGLPKGEDGLGDRTPRRARRSRRSVRIVTNWPYGSAYDPKP